MGGGPSNAQNQAAARQGELASVEGKIAQDNAQLVKDQYNKIDPYATTRLNRGLPYFPAVTDYASGTSARAYAPARAAALRNLAPISAALPSGFRTSMLNDINEAQAQNFDQNLTGNLAANEAAKGEAARVLTGQQQVVNPAAYFSGAEGANSSIINASTLAKPGLGGLFGGIASGAASAIPF